MRKTLWMLGMCCLASLDGAGGGMVGSNVDPAPGPAGEKPYEMVMRGDDHEPLITFEDCTRWVVEGDHAEAALYRTEEEKLYRDYAGKLWFRAQGDNAEIRLRPVEKLMIDEPWNAVAVWNHGLSWVWQAQDKDHPWPQMSVLVRGADGKEYEIDGFARMYYDYWFYQRRLVNQPIPRPAEFVGLKFRNFSNDRPLAIYLDCVYFYQASERPLTFAPWPEQLPFPVRGETILPDQLTADFSNAVERVAPDTVAFVYRGDDGELRYEWKLDAPFLDGLKVIGPEGAVAPAVGAGVVLADGEKATLKLLENQLSGGVLHLKYLAAGTHAEARLDCEVAIKQKSLVFDFREETASAGQIARLELGRAEQTGPHQLFRLPFLTYGGVDTDPRMLLAKGLYLFSQFDWYVSNASELVGGEASGADFARFNGAAVYNAISDGTRNPLRERLFLNVSANPWEVFPTVDNPPSPFREIQGDRLWRVASSHSPEELALNTRLRRLGLEKITIRYHEDDWRDSGDSYTFRLHAAPKKGGDAALKQFVAAVRQLGWKIGLYTNYTDFAPVNPLWDEDNMMWRQDGNWLDSWARCYAPKPMWGVEMQAELAPQIQAKFGEDHSYCDVHTAVTPFSRVDYDARVPGAGMFRRTFECYGRILYNEKFAHQGPAYSEGVNHWWYAGLVDGNYAQLMSNDRPNELWFPDFALRKLHILEMDAGMGSPGMFFGSRSWNMPQFIATSFAYGNIGFADNGHDDAAVMNIYYLMQPVQAGYVMEPVEAILYERDGIEYPTAAALVNGAWRDGRLRVRYANGFEMRLNANAEVWDDLPQWGWQVHSADRSRWSVRRLVDGKVVEASSGPDSCYFNSADGEAAYGGMRGEGAAALKREAGGWELIPARQYRSFAFAPELIGAGDGALTAIGVDADGNEVERRALLPASDGLLSAPAVNPAVFKYLLRRN